MKVQYDTHMLEFEKRASDLHYPASESRVRLSPHSITSFSSQFTFFPHYHHSLTMLPLLQFIALLLHFIFVSSFSSALPQNHDDPTIRTMEAFSGYPVHEPSSLLISNPISSLSVDADTLVKQVWKLNGL